jgi:glucose/arabinose dehydrogenase
MLLAAACSSSEIPELASTESEELADAGARIFQTASYEIRVVTVAEGLVRPYSVAFLPDGDMLVTELEGRLRRVRRNGEVVSDPISGIPEVVNDMGESGLMDLALHPDFSENHWVYFTYNKAGERGATMALARGTLDGMALNDVADIFVAEAWSMRAGHLSARMVFAPDRMLYIALSDRNMPEEAQNMNSHMGKVVRLRDDGSVPTDNPFVGREGHLPEIFTLGHRNPHGIAVHPETGEVWEQEHGDEINRLVAGANYGWPYVGVGGEGGGEALGHPPPDVELMEPEVTLNPAPGTHGLMFYTGDRFPQWQGDLFVSGSRAQSSLRIDFDGQRSVGREFLFTDWGKRIRDVRQGPDGLIYLTTDDPADIIMRIEPVE